MTASGVAVQSQWLHCTCKLIVTNVPSSPGPRLDELTRNYMYARELSVPRRKGRHWDEVHDGRDESVYKSSSTANQCEVVAVIHCRH